MICTAATKPSFLISCVAVKGWVSNSKFVPALQTKSVSLPTSCLICNGRKTVLLGVIKLWGIATPPSPPLCSKNIMGTRDRLQKPFNSLSSASPAVIPFSTVLQWLWNSIWLGDHSQITIQLNMHVFGLWAEALAGTGRTQSEMIVNLQELLQK